MVCRPQTATWEMMLCDVWPNVHIFSSVTKQSNCQLIKRLQSFGDLELIPSVLGLLWQTLFYLNDYVYKTS